MAVVTAGRVDGTRTPSDGDAVSDGRPALRIARRPTPVIARALALWPGLDRTALARTHGDPVRIARLVARRSALPETAILALLGGR